MEGFATNGPEYKWVSLRVFFTPFKTGRGPPCMGEINPQKKMKEQKHVIWIYSES